MNEILILTKLLFPFGLGMLRQVRIQYNCFSKIFKEKLYQPYNLKLQGNKLQSSQLFYRNL